MIKITKPESLIYQRIGGKREKNTRYNYPDNMIKKITTKRAVN